MRAPEVGAEDDFGADVSPASGIRLAISSFALRITSLPTVTESKGATHVFTRPAPIPPEQLEATTPGEPMS
jgi:hypothetical protein